VPQWLAIAGMAYVIATAAPAPELERPIFTALAGVLGLVAVIGTVWVLGVMRRAPFTPLEDHDAPGH
jgi:hypothetical protein